METSVLNLPLDPEIKRLKDRVNGLLDTCKARNVIIAEQKQSISTLEGLLAEAKTLQLLADLPSQSGVFMSNCDVFQNVISELWKKGLIWAVSRRSDRVGYCVESSVFRDKIHVFNTIKAPVLHYIQDWAKYGFLTSETTESTTKNGKTISIFRLNYHICNTIRDELLIESGKK